MLQNPDILTCYGQRGGLASRSWWWSRAARGIGIPHTLADLGMAAGQVDRFAEMAAVDPCAAGNPIKVGAPELKRMYLAALDGWL
ncbi:MAG: hypothetical protein ACT4P2_16020 [Pseudomonadota bacterium]